MVFEHKTDLAKAPSADIQYHGKSTYRLGAGANLCIPGSVSRMFEAWRKQAAYRVVLDRGVLQLGWARHYGAEERTRRWNALCSRSSSGVPHFILASAARSSLD
jgi:hypothetical protein